MQILYWHLTRPQTSTCGGSVSPPLFRRDDGTSSSAGTNFPKTSEESALAPCGTGISKVEIYHNIPSPPPLINEKGDTGDSHQSQHKNRAMEIENDDQTPTFYYIQHRYAVDLPEEEDSALNHHLELIQGAQNDLPFNNNGPFVAVGKSPPGNGGNGDGPPGGHYSSQLRKGSANKRKKRRSNDLARVLSIEDESDDETSVNVGPSKSKKAKLIVNLYPEEQGYSFAYQVPGSDECSESHSIPYTERYLLDSIDLEQIPHKMLLKLEDREGVHLMRYRNQVVAEIRDYRKSIPSQAPSVPRFVPQTVTSGSSNILLNGTLSRTNEQNSKKPVVKQVMLRPTTESLLCDFDQIVEKAHEDRGGWNAVLRQSLVSGDLSHMSRDGSDSEYEYEVDLEASQNNHCNFLTFEQRLELEKKFVNQTAEPICLDPSPQVGLIANRMQYEKFKWNAEEMVMAAKRWEENPFKHNKILISTPDTSLNAPSLAEGRTCPEPFYNYVMTVKAKRELASRGLGQGTVDKDALRLPPISYQDYPNVDPPKVIDEIQRIGQIPEPAQLRIFPNENYVRKIEEYILETERRKRPHITKLAIFQRNGMESFFGELEMESFLDPAQPRVATAPASTKCQFELGSSRNVTLYVKQFSDIFTEDGRRPCKITYQKVGQPPQVVYTNSYKSATSTPPVPTTVQVQVPAPSQTPEVVAASLPLVVSTTSAPIVVNASASSTATVTVAAPATSSIVASTPQIVHVAAGSTVTVPGIVSVTQPQVQLQRPPTPATATTVVVHAVTTSATTTAPSLPPVQIVHPQPRAIPQQQQQPQQQQKPQTTSQRQIQIFSQQQAPTQNITVPQSASQAQANVNLNVNLNSSGIAPQQVLTRPHIVNVNLQQQQQAAAQQQLLQLTQQRILRMKQQQPNTALAKLLLTNLQTKPITVAVQPTPQNPANVAAAANNGNSPVCGNPSPSSAASCSTNSNANSATAASPVDAQQQNPLGSPLMISSPPSVSSAITNPSPNVNVNVNTSPNLSVNLNTISLDGLLNATSANYGNATTITTNQAGGNLVAASNVNLGLSRITTNSGQSAVNILRLNNNTGTVATAAGGNTVQLAAVQRQLAVSNALNGNVSILQQGSQQPQQRILINANSVNNLNLNSVGTSGEIDELSVPDLTTLLGGQPIQISQLGQQQHILTNASASAPSQTTIDTTNLNLNLNVNLNSGTVVNNGEGQVQQHQIAKIQGGEWTTTAQAPPFLVFISPLRQMPIAASAAQGTATTRQVTATATGATSNSQALSLNLGGASQQPQQIVQSQASKMQEGPTRILLGTCNNGVAIKREVATPVPTTIVAASAVGSGDSNNLSQSQVLDSMEGHLLDAQQVVSSSDVVVDGVDSLFNALSEAIGPEQLQKLDAIGGSLAAASSSSISTSQIPSSVMDTLRVVSASSNATSVHIGAATQASSSTPSPIVSALSNNNSITSSKCNSSNVITLSDLLGSPTMVSSSTGNASSFPSLILSSVSTSGGGTSSSTMINSSPTLSSLLNSVHSAQGLSAVGSSQATASITQSSIVSSTPRLSALLAGTPSADTVVVGTNGPPSILGPTGTADSSTGAQQSSTSYGTLLDRLAASLNQPQASANQVRTSTLHPIASATPSVVLDHPVLAATLTQQQQQGTGNITGNVAGVNRGPSTFRQIAPAPSPGTPAASTSASNTGNVAVISSSDIQSHAIQSPQLINLLGLVGNNSGGAGAGQTRTIRISASSPASNPSPGSASR